VGESVSESEADEVGTEEDALEGTTSSQEDTSLSSSF
jgi:hypothetical protein